MADMLLGDINNAVAELEKLDYPTDVYKRQECGRLASYITQQ